MAQKRRNHKKLIWWGIGVILVVAIVVGVVVGINSNTGKTDNSEATRIEEQEETSKDETNNSDLTKATTEENDKKVKQYEGADPNEAEELSGVVTYANANGGTLIIRTSIDQYLTDGTCDLTLNRAGVTIYSSTASIVGDASTSRCDGFDIPVANLEEGNLEIIINLSANNKSGVIRGEASI